MMPNSSRNSNTCMNIEDFIGIQTRRRLITPPKCHTLGKHGNISFSGTHPVLRRRPEVHMRSCAFMIFRFCPGIFLSFSATMFRSCSKHVSVVIVSNTFSLSLISETKSTFHVSKQATLAYSRSCSDLFSPHADYEQEGFSSLQAFLCNRFIT